MHDDERFDYLTSQRFSERIVSLAFLSPLDYAHKLVRVGLFVPDPSTVEFNSEPYGGHLRGVTRCGEQDYPTQIDAFGSHGLIRRYNKLASKENQALVSISVRGLMAARRTRVS